MLSKTFYQACVDERIAQRQLQLALLYDLGNPNEEVFMKLGDARMPSCRRSLASIPGARPLGRSPLRVFLDTPEDDVDALCAALAKLAS